jgi:hypothetical protein
LDELHRRAAIPGIWRRPAQRLRPRIQDARRSPADQLKAFESGHSKLRYGFQRHGEALEKETNPSVEREAAIGR